MDALIRQQVWSRAEGRCEYCRLKQEHESALAFHVEHIIALQHRGPSTLGNLALACGHCNAHKGTNLTSRDPDTDKVELLFHPRQQAWHEHFHLDGALVIGLTPAGRTTVWLLQINIEHRVHLREWLIAEAEWD
ncbi:MAG: HNH endonuclease [Prosthecobacter sp.]|uniref:HNH endonuclease n=1 Tax=Prosthecobacter sp. TaxID=1965333 RepID=UPI0038FEB102